MEEIDKNLLKSPDLHEVVISSTVFLKMLKHCKEQYPIAVTGQLLGIDISGSLKVMNCFPFIKQQKASDDTQEEVEGASYQLKIHRTLRSLGYETNAVGWYQITHLNSYWSRSLIETQFNYQISFPRSVLIVCDYTKNVQDSFKIKAMYLKPTLIKLLKEGIVGPSSLDLDVSIESIFEQVPVRVENLHLAAALLNELNVPKAPNVPIGLPIGLLFEDSNPFIGNIGLAQQIVDCQIVTPNLHILGPGQDEFLEKHVEYFSEVIDEHNNDTWRWHCWYKAVVREQQHIIQTSSSRQGKIKSLADLKKLSNREIQQQCPVLAKLLSSEPGRVESLIVSNQANTCSKQINEMSGNLLTKLYLTYGLAFPSMESNDSETRVD